jgi:predicted PurR-regulated permease PerM
MLPVFTKQILNKKLPLSTVRHILNLKPLYMSDQNSAGGKISIRQIAEISVKMVLLFLLLYWCYNILKPFLDILLWSVIFSVGLYPVYKWTHQKLGGKKTLASVIIVLLMMALLLLPVIIFAKSLYEGITYLKTQYEAADRVLPIAPEQINSWPVVGPFLYEKWNWISLHLSEASAQYAPQIKQAVLGLVSSAASAGAAFIKLILSLIISAFLLVNSKKAAILAYKVFNNLLGDIGDEFAAMAEKTIRTVVTGVLGVAFIQSLMFGIAMVLAGVPAAGLWVMLSLIFGIIQIGIFPVTIPVVIYVIATKSTVTIVVFVIWSIIVSLIDNILKPILLGHGAVVPMPVIFIGSIGGFIQSGIVGLFTGAIIFSIGYKLFQLWLEQREG